MQLLLGNPHDKQSFVKLSKLPSPQVLAKLKEVGKFFATTDVVVLPYKTASQSGIVQIAYHYDTPVIVSNVGGLPEIVDEGKTGFCVEPNPGSFADAIRSFYSIEDKESFRSNIAEYKKRFSWDAMVKTVEELSHAG